MVKPENIMTVIDYIRQMPKVELHVHIEGSIRPETLLTLAQRNHVDLPFDTLDGLRQWYTFIDFPHFVDIYVEITRCLKTVDDIELVTREFLQGQAGQHILHTEATYTAETVRLLHSIAYDDQLAAINRARAWARRDLGVTMALIVDIAREVPPDVGVRIARWVAGAHDMETGVAALGLGGYEVGHPAEKHAAAFKLARGAGVPCILHAGETSGPESIWGAIRVADTQRIGHGVRCVEDPPLVAYLREKQIPLEVCPTSNVCLKVCPSLAKHPLPQLLKDGLYVTLNSDDPPMFNTTLTDEYITCANTFGWDVSTVRQLVLNAAKAALLPQPRKRALIARLAASTVA